MTTLDLHGIASRGGGLDVSARGFRALDFHGIAKAGSTHGAKLIIRDAGACLSVLDMHGIAAQSPGNVTFVL